MQREPTAYRSLLMVAGAVMADPKAMLARLVCGCIALAFTASVPAVAFSHCLAEDAIKGGKLSYMAVVLQREPTAYRSLLMVAGAVLADPKAMLSRLVCGCIALTFTASVLAEQSSLPRPCAYRQRAASSATWHWRCNASQLHTDCC